MTPEPQIDPPTSSEDDGSSAYDTLVQIQTALSVVQQDMSCLPSEIAHLRSEITRLESDLAHRLIQEQTLLRDVEKHQRIVKLRSYTDRLPNEILAHVFLLLVDPDSVGPSSGHFYPWRTAAVCTRWRAICMDTPTLWAYIRWGRPIHSCKDSLETALLYESRISMQLERSKAAPLFIRYHILCMCPTVISITRAVVAHAQRWKKANIDSGSEICIQNLRSIILPGTTFTTIEELVWDANGEHLDIPYTDYGSLESLRHVKLWGLNDLPLDVKIPWGHLISLKIWYYSNNLDDLLSVLPHCQALHTLHLHTHLDNSNESLDDIDIEKKSISLPHVTEADFYCTDSKSYIPYIRCPSLRKLTTRSFDDEDSSQVLANFIIRSQCQELLENLTIDSSEALAYSISPLLRACSAIESLSILCSSRPFSAQNEFISSLILQREATDSWLCPRLKRLQLVGPNPDIRLVQRMIDSRLNVSQPAASLKYLRWDCIEDWRDKIAVFIRRSILENSYSFQDISFAFTFT